MDWYVATDGQQTNSGTLSDPWDLTSALVNSIVQPGDTIHLRRGLYRHPDRSPLGAYQLHLTGQPDQHVTVCPYQQEHVTLDGGIVTEGTPQHVTIRDLEILVSENVGDPRIVSGTTSYSALDRPYGGIEISLGHDIRLVNNVIHDCSRGLHIWAKVSGESECYGNILYNNGWMASDRGHGHGIYTQNSSQDWKYFHSNIVANSWSMNLHAYGSSQARIERMEFAGNVFYETDTRFDGRALIGCRNDESNKQLRVTNNLFHHVNLQVGYAGHVVDEATITGNTVVLAYIEAGVANSIVENNFVWREERIAGTYTGQLEPLPRDGAPIPDRPWVYMDLNRYDSARATIVIYNFTAETSVAFDPSGVLASGDDYELRDPLDFYGRPVLAGRFDGKPLDVPTADKDFLCLVLLRKEPQTKRKWYFQLTEVDGTGRPIGDPKKVTVEEP